MRRRARLLLLLTALPLISGPGCESPRIAQRPFRAHPVARVLKANHQLGAPGPTSASEVAFVQLKCEVETPGGATPTRLLGLAELADGIGRRELLHDPAFALTWFRDAAAYSAFCLMAEESPGSPVRARAVDLHNHAVEELLRCAGSGPKNPNPVWREQLAAIGVRTVATSPERVALPIDELWIASDFRVEHLERVEWPGLGVPLITLSRFPNRQAVPDRFQPERLRLPATAVFRPGGPLQAGAWRSAPAVLELHDPANEPCVALAPGRPGTRLAGDLTTPIAHQFIQSPLALFAWGGLLRPGDFGETVGVFQYGPYRPGKIPVLFIHGLWSSPEAWLEMAAALQADPAIRSRYQFWFAYYPSGAPLMVSAAKVRRSLRELRQAIDPGHNDPALDQMVVVGHSLGGVMSKQLIQSSGRSLERVLLTRPFEQVAMSDGTRELLSRIIHFEPVPSVRRVVFIAAPHRGSNTANRLVGRLGSALVRRPEDVTAVYQEVMAMNGPEVLHPAYRRRPPNSIDNLEWDSPILKALSGLPMAPGVPYHSIVANLFPEGPPRLWTDGVVSYESAHLDGAESEIMIRSNHFANDAPEATAEVRRILRLHLTLSDAPRP